MEAIPQTKPVVRRGRRLKVVLASVVVASLIAGTWVWRNHSDATAVTSKSTEAIPVLTAVVKQTNVPVRACGEWHGIRAADCCGAAAAQRRDQLRTYQGRAICEKGRKTFSRLMHVPKMPISAGLKDNWRRPAPTCEMPSVISNASVNFFVRILFHRLRLTWRRIRSRRCAASLQSIRPRCRPIALPRFQRNRCTHCGTYRRHLGISGQPGAAERCIGEHHADRSDQCQFHLAGT